MCVYIPSLPLTLWEHCLTVSSVTDMAWVPLGPILVDLLFPLSLSLTLNFNV